MLNLAETAEIDLLSWSLYAYFRNDVSTSAHVDNTRSTENAYTKPAAYTRKRSQSFSCPLVK